VMAIDGQWSVQDVPYAKLRDRLLQDGQVLEYSGTVSSGASSGGGRSGIDPAKLSGIVVDDSQAKVTGAWKESTAAKSWLGNSYRHDGNTRDGRSTARFEKKLAKPGRYEVRLAYTPNANRSSKVSVVVHHAQGEKTVEVNQQQAPPIDGLFVSLGEFDFTPDQPAAVTITNRAANGYVIIDGVQWIPQAK
jgi:hypothetical protein